VKSAGVNESGLPDEAIDELLRRSGRKRSDIVTYAGAESGAVLVPGGSEVALDHHFAHACSAFLPSPFTDATVFICDHEPPYLSLWEGNGGHLRRIEDGWEGPGFANLYSECAEVLGFTGNGKEQRFEALARLEGTVTDNIAGLINLSDSRLQLASNWRGRLETIVKTVGAAEVGQVAAGLQHRLGTLLIEYLRALKAGGAGEAKLCLGGSLFYNSYFNSRIKCSGLFETVFVPVDPGNAGLAIGTVLSARGGKRERVSPFLGPAYDPYEIKKVLDNCKLHYDWVSRGDAVSGAVDALRQGRLVAWFEGSMEWGARALGGRSILANPFAPYVLENLNLFLKQREKWRGYALSATVQAVTDHFDGPATSPYMECDYSPKDRQRFAPVLPCRNSQLRIQTVDSDAPEGFKTLLEAFGTVSGFSGLVNTSFNGFSEPIVCSPRDAIRIFFGTGIDLMVLGEFVLSK
jgi:carbamoyltransferase